MKSVLIFVLAAVAAGCSSAATMPAPAPLHPIQHVVILLQENRSFNTLFMGFPGAETSTTGKCKNPGGQAPWCPKSGIVRMRPTTLEEKRVIGGADDIDHSHHAFETECDPDSAGICAMDGFDLIGYGESGSQGAAHNFPYRFVERSETKPYWDFASRYALADRMFFTDTAASFIAHQEIIAGTVALSPNESLTDQPNQAPWGCDGPGPHKGPYQVTFTPVIDRNGHVNPRGPFPCFDEYKTIADLLDAKGTSWKYYVDGVYGGDFSGGVWNGFDAIRAVRYGPDWKAHMSNPNTSVFKDLKNGTLPQVSWVIPTLCASDHPASGANRGPLWVTQVVDAIGRSKYWSSTAIVLLWDDWGGWYDGVPPPQTDYTSLGFRVPMLVISPYAKPHYVSHTQYNFGSVLKFVEQNFGLGSLGTTDAGATSMADVFDYSQRPAAFQPEPLPHVLKCPRQEPADQIIKSDGGVPE